MFRTDIAFYVGEEKNDGYSGYLAESNFFLIMEIEEGMPPEEGRATIQKIKAKFTAINILSLNDFEHMIADAIKEYNIPSGVSLTAGYLHGPILYLKSMGSGCVFLQRKKQFGKLVGSNQSASGYIEDGDIFVFTTFRFVEKSGGEQELKKSIDHHHPHQIVDTLVQKVKITDDQGLIALFASFSKQTEIIPDTFGKEEIDSKEYSEEEKIEEPIFVSKIKIWDKPFAALKQLYGSTQQSIGEAEKKKTYTLAAVAVIFCILVWSVGLGYIRRGEASKEKKIASSKIIITQKLNQADESAFLNLSQSLVLIGEARQELDKLKKDIPKGKEKEIKDIETAIDNEQNKLEKKEEKSYEEFFDLQVDSQNAKGTELSLNQDNLLVLDNAQGNIYSLSIAKKSLNKQTFDEIKNARLIGGYQNALFFYTDKNGIYTVNADEKPKKIIDKDSEWQSVIDMWIYNGNIYVLDKGKEIHKYLVAENGYSGKTSYFKEGQSISLQDANSFAIDSSLYIGFSDSVKKFTAGIQDDFKTSYPRQNITVSKIFTSKDIDKVYILDKQNSSLYILGKDGTYEREIHSSLLKQSNDFVVYDGATYVLYGSKIYKITL